MTKARHKTETRTLLETVRLGGPLKFNEASGLFEDLKILGFDSDNGRKYLPEALRAGVSLYEGKMVNCNHPGAPTDQRSVYDRLGKFVNVRFVEGDGYRGNLKPFKTHEMTARLREAATDPDLIDCLAFSHNADGKGKMIDGVFVVEEIVKVRSVDLVADGATTRSLTEGIENKSKGKKTMSKRVAVRTVLENMTANTKCPLRVRRKLLEAMDDDKRTKGTLCEMDAEDGPMMDEPAEEADPMETIKDGYESACMPLLRDALEGDDEALKKLNDYIKHHRKLADKETEEAEGGDMERSEKGERAEDEEEDDKDPESGPRKPDGADASKRRDRAGGGTESRKHKVTPGSAALTEAVCKRLCVTAGVKDSPQLLSAMAKTGDVDGALAVLEAIKAPTQADSQRRSSGAPRSSGASFPTPTGTGNGAVTEQSFLEAITGHRN